MEIRKKTIKNYTIVIFGTAFSRSVAFFNSVIIARLLGPKGFGEFAIFQIVMILTWQFAQACDTAFVRYARASQSWDEKKAFLKSAVLAKLGYAALVLLASYPVAKTLANYVFDKARLFPYLMASIICGGFICFLMTAGSHFQARERFVSYSLVVAAFPVAILLCLGLGYVTISDFSLGKMIFLFLVIAILTGSFALVFLIRTGGNPFRLEKHAMEKTLNLGKWILGVTIVFFLFQRVDTLALSRFLTSEKIGVYYAATQIVMFVGLFSGPLSNVFLPMASTALESRENMERFVKESIVAGCMVGLFIVLLYVTAPKIIDVAYGSEYRLAVPITRILLVGWLFWVLYQPFSYLFYTLEDSKTRFLMELMKLVVAIIGLTLLIPSKGTVGAAFAITLTRQFRRLCFGEKSAQGG